jgi:hypothetical protein
MIKKALNFWGKISRLQSCEQVLWSLPAPIHWQSCIRLEYISQFETFGTCLFIASPGCPFAPKRCARIAFVVPSVLVPSVLIDPNKQRAIKKAEWNWTRRHLFEANSINVSFQDFSDLIL